MSLANLKKGDTVILHMFTGIAVGVKEVLAADKNTVTLETRIGKAKFSRKTGKQVEPKAKQDRFANYITEDDGSYEPSGAQAKTSKKKSKKTEDKKSKTKAKAKAAEVEEDEDEAEDEEEEAPSKNTKSKKTAKKPTKKSKPVEDEDDEEDDDEEYEEEE